MDLYDTTVAINENAGESGALLADTLQYKLLTICGQLVRVNKKTRMQTAWIEDTRAVFVEPEEKQELITVMGGGKRVAEDPNMMAIAIEFRLKPLISQNSVAGAKSEGESKASKQLKSDCAALADEHPTQVCFTYDEQKVLQASQLIFRTYNVEETGHSIN